MNCVRLGRRGSSQGAQFIAPLHPFPDSFVHLFRCCVNGVSRASTVGAGIVSSNRLFILVSQSGNSIHQITNACPAEKLEESWDLCHHIHDVTGEPTGAESVISIAAPSGDDGYFVHLAQRL